MSDLDVSAPTAAETDLPKLGPNAVPITADFAFLKATPAPNYWALAPFVKPQTTSSNCSLASVTAAVNGLRGLPASAGEVIMTQEELLDLVADAEWTRCTASGGGGVTFEELGRFTKKALAALGLDYEVTQFHPGTATPEAGNEMRAWLSRNEQSADDLLLLYFHQGTITGHWDGLHVSLIGAYDAATDRVLVLEVDQHWHIHYWTPADVLLTAITTAISGDAGKLTGETGGFVRVAPKG